MLAATTRSTSTPAATPAPSLASGAMTTMPPPARPMNPPMPPQPTGGYPPPGPYGPPPSRRPGRPNLTAVGLLGLISVACVALGLSIDEDGANQWSRVHAWGWSRSVAAIATLAPAVARTVGLNAERAWRVAACGAGGLVLFWVLFTLPYVGSNTSLVVTVGVGAGALAAWIAPGRAPAAPHQGW